MTDKMTDKMMELAVDYRDAPNAQAGAAHKTLRTAIGELVTDSAGLREQNTMLDQKLAELDDARSECSALRVNKQNLEALLQQVREWIAERPEGRTVSAGKMVAMLMEAPQPAAEPAGEPVAWMRPGEAGYDSAFRDHSTVIACTGNLWSGWVPLYTAPQPAQREQLTDVAPELLAALKGLIDLAGPSCVGAWDVARAAIDKAEGKP